MRERTVRRLLGTVGATVALVTVAACEFEYSLGGKSVPADEVAAEAARMLEREVGQAPDDLTCPEDLPAEVGASIRCELVAGSDTLGVTITTTDVNGDIVDFDVQVDDTVRNGGGHNGVTGGGDPAGGDDPAGDGDVGGGGGGRR